MSAPIGVFRFERSISLALVFALVLETAGAFTWAGAVAERVDHLERQADNASAVNERLARLEEQAAATRAQLDRIEARLAPR